MAALNSSPRFMATHPGAPGRITAAPPLFTWEALDDSPSLTTLRELPAAIPDAPGLPGHDGSSNTVYDEAGTVYGYDKVSDPPVRADHALHSVREARRDSTSRPSRAPREE